MKTRTSPDATGDRDKERSRVIMYGREAHLGSPYAETLDDIDALSLSEL